MNNSYTFQSPTKKIEAEEEKNSLPKIKARILQENVN